ncbi:MAG: CRISPR-associated endonuclease Cas2 [Candidatus Rehaiarchaeum fermentans]|nr:CRISPR-associated endonuclease Cas2 [Candidatus Rehaiarchaeum fermentans]MCW1292516.1 CRISPR-associated endonuclease Cas2 [Candidatus Rehaiarchaeum fermentans]
MFYIVTYDVQQERVNKVCQLLRRYLNWVQNSVFEGELSEASMLELKSYLNEILDKTKDSIFIYSVRSKEEIKKDILGVEKVDTSRFL